MEQLIKSRHDVLLSCKNLLLCSVYLIPEYLEIFRR